MMIFDRETRYFFRISVACIVIQQVDFGIVLQRFLIESLKSEQRDYFFGVFLHIVVYFYGNIRHSIVVREPQLV